jgi:uncharacterized membrane protein
VDEAPKTDQTLSAPVATPEDVEKAKGTAWLSYLGILWLVPLLTMKDNAFAKFHVKQGIVLTIYGFAVGIVGGAIPFLGWFIVAPVGSVIILVLAIMGIVNSLGGKYWKCPLGVSILAEKWFNF